MGMAGVDSSISPWMTVDLQEGQMEGGKLFADMEKCEGCSASLGAVKV